MISKGDYLTTDTIPFWKNEVNTLAERNGVSWFNSSLALRENKEKLKELKRSTLGESPPFLIINSNSSIQGEDGEVKIGRKYSWGVCEVTNPKHTDFKLLYSLIVGYHPLHFIARTDTLFEVYWETKRVLRMRELKDSRNSHAGVDFGIGFLAGALGASLASFFITRLLSKNFK